MHWQMLLMTAAIGPSDGLVMLEFTADWCPACRTMEASVDRLIQAGYPVRRVQVDRHPDLVTRHRVVKMPTFVLLRDGEEVARVVGPTSYARLEQMIRRARPPTAPPKPVQQATLNRASLVKVSRPAGESLEQSILESTVRIEVRDARGINLGSGTVIDARDGHALVLTCGHLLRDSEGRGKILVELFGRQGRRKLPGQLIRFDADREDIAILSIQPGEKIPFRPIASATSRLARGLAVWSAGCDRGDEPSVRRSRINSVNRYHGPDNIQIQGLPADGRSGGGLFNERGELIGVCNAADPLDEEGFYSSLSNVHHQLQQAGLAFVIPVERRSPLVVRRIQGRRLAIVEGPDGEQLFVHDPQRGDLKTLVEQAQKSGRAIPDGILQAAGVGSASGLNGHGGRAAVIRAQSDKE